MIVKLFFMDDLTQAYAHALKSKDVEAANRLDNVLNIKAEP